MVDYDVVNIPLQAVISGPTRIGVCDTLRVHALFTNGILGARPFDYEWQIPDSIANNTNCMVDISKSILEIKPSCFIQNPTNETWKLFTFQLKVVRTLKFTSSSKYFFVNRTSLFCIFCQKCNKKKLSFFASASGHFT